MLKNKKIKQNWVQGTIFKWNNVKKKRWVRENVGTLFGGGGGGVVVVFDIQTVGVTIYKMWPEIPV